MGWFFGSPAASSEQFVSDLVADADLRVVNSLFPLWCLLTLALPFAMGWAWGGRLSSGLSALLWAGAVRICLLHHVTWSINSICHAFGRRPFLTGDRSTNVPALALVSMGESWHNAHHAFPTLARHGVDRWQWDSSAALIRVFEVMRWTHDVHWPESARLDRRRLRLGATPTQRHLGAAHQRTAAPDLGIVVDGPSGRNVGTPPLRALPEWEQGQAV
jgi:stearoyl-CoA desaturase (delta-9 desaturase)